MAVNALAGLAREAASSPFMRGLTALPYRLAGGPVDLADMVVRPIANAAGIPIAEPEDMYGTSDWMIKQAIDAGLLMPRTDTGAEMAGDFLGQIAAPGVGPGEMAMASSIGAIPMKAANALADLGAAGGSQMARAGSQSGIDLYSPGLRDVKIGDSTISYRVSDDGSVEIGSLRTPQARRGRGSARIAMNQFLAEADIAGATVKLGASPLDSRTRLDRLVNFYRSVGFEPTGRKINALGEPEMIRPPMRAATNKD